MRVATWNLNFCLRQAGLEPYEASWPFLEKAVRPDIALVQEAVPREGLAAVSRGGGIGPTRPWGSAVISYGPRITPITTMKSPYGKGEELRLDRTWPGSMAIAEIQDLSLVVVSVYGLMEAGYAITTVHRLLSDLTPLLDTKRGRRIIVGGDLNCSTQLKPPDRERHRNLFQRFASLQLIDVLAENRPPRAPLATCRCEDEPCRHIQTRRDPRNPAKPWHLDYLFASPEVAERLVSCAALDEPTVWNHSDHCPVVAEFDL